MTKTKYLNAAAFIGVILLIMVLPVSADQFTINSITPDVGYNNGTIFISNLQGSNFTSPATATLWNGSTVISISGGVISAVLYAGNADLNGQPAGFYNVTVVNGTDPLNNATLTNGFLIVNPPPELTSISPNSGLNNGTSTIAFTGIGILPGATANITNGSYIVSGTPTIPFTYTFDFTGLEAGAWDAYVVNTDGNQSNPQPFTLYNVPPSISNANPASGVNSLAIPVLIRVSGNNFLPGATVIFTNVASTIPIEGIPTVTTSYIDVPLNLSYVPVGFYNVTVTNPGGEYNTTTALHAFKVNYANAPSLTGINPTTGVNNGDQNVTITGNNFQNGVTVILHNPSHPNITATVNTVSLTNIDATLPLNGVPVDTWSLIVQNNDGQGATLPSAFTTVYPAPVVSSVTPSSGTNTGVINITDLHGNWFRTGATVKLTRTGQADIPGTSVIVDSQNRILCLFDLTGKLAGPWNVTVTNTDSQSGTLINGFTVTQPAPTIASINPNTGTNVESLNNVHLAGTGFVSGATVVLNKTGQADIPGTSLTVVNGTTITFNVNLAGAAPGAWNVIVTNLDTQSSTLPGGFTITSPAPVITGIEPSTGLNNGPVGIYNLSGQYFQTGANVSLVKGVTTIPGTSVTVTPTKITCFFDITGVAVGGWDVKVENPDIQADTLDNGFYVFYPAAPTVTLLNPDTGINTAPVSIVVTGTEFHPGLMANLTRGSDVIPGTISGISGTGFTGDFNITGAAVGTWDIKVTNDDGQFVVKTGAFEVTAPVPPAGNVTATPTTGTAPLDVQFNISITDGTPPFTYLWNLGDGTNSTEQNPYHTYTVAGTYSPSVAITNAAGTVSAAGPEIIVNEPVTPPVADFTATPSSGVAPLQVQFNDTSSGSLPFTYSWDFGDGIGTSTQKDPQYTYITAGTYTANLTVTNTAGTSSKNSTISVSAAPIPPVANFSASPTHGFKPLYVEFTDHSASNITSWYWTFGPDMYSAGAQNPSFTYNTVGNFTVNLTVTNATGTATMSKPEYIIVTNKPVSNFTASPTSGIRPLEVNFTDLSTDATGWYWDFGDGTNSTEQNPSHTYANEGVYDVMLTASNAGGNGDTLAKFDYIGVRIPGPVAGFTAAPTSGDKPLTVHFNDTSTGTPTAWNWDFGDYNSSNLQNPTHTYSTTGVFTVRLEVSNSGGSNATVKPDLVNVTQPRPVADFTFTPPNGTAPLTVTFLDLSTNDPTAWNWDFGDGSTSTLQNPTHTYTHSSSSTGFIVRMSCSNAGGTSPNVRQGTIVVKNPPPVANFTGTPVLGTVPVTVQFNDTSSNFPTFWIWDFGDGTVGTGRNPVHTYNKVGSYTVNLSVVDSTTGASSSISRPAYITVVKTPIAAFSAEPTNGTAPLVVRFTDQSQGKPIRYYWKFGDGTTSAAKNPTHTYSRPGVYTVTLTVQNAAGFNTTTKQNLISVNVLPQAAFFASPTGGNPPLSVQFTDTSTGNPTAWSWDFGDQSTSTEKNPSHTYMSPGVYSVRLVVSNSLGSSTVTKDNMINVGVPAGADFTAKPVTGNVPLMIQVTDTSSGTPLIHNWQFGDGFTSKEENPIHVYTRPGTYNVTLSIITNTGATSTITKPVTVTSIPVASFKANPTSGSDPLTVQFTDTSANKPTYHFWTFGDGTFGNDVVNPVHTYNSPGTYNVTLFVSNADGHDEITYHGLISVSRFPV